MSFPNDDPEARVPWKNKKVNAVPHEEEAGGTSCGCGCCLPEEGGSIEKWCPFFPVALWLCSKMQKTKNKGTETKKKEMKAKYQKAKIAKDNLLITP